MRSHEALRGASRQALAQGGLNPEKSGKAVTKGFVEGRLTDTLGTVNQHAPTRLKAATGSTYCKAIVANRKLPFQGTKTLGAETRALMKKYAPGRLEADDLVAFRCSSCGGQP